MESAIRVRVEPVLPPSASAKSERVCNHRQPRNCRDAVACDRGVERGSCRLPRLWATAIVGHVARRRATAGARHRTGTFAASLSRGAPALLCRQSL